jgi:putative pyruvate formate lyase activating enzyme
MVSAAAEQARGLGRRLPFVYNSSGYERVATLEQYGELCDVFLADLRYASNATAARLSGADDYVGVAREAIRAMWRARGPLEVDEDGVARRGVICRLLILPGLADETVANLRWLAETLGTDAAVSVMAQYVPAYRAGGVAGMDRRITLDEYETVWNEVERIGFSMGWVQDFGEEGPAELLGFRMNADGVDNDTPPRNPAAETVPDPGV